MPFSSFLRSVLVVTVLGASIGAAIVPARAEAYACPPYAEPQITIQPIVAQERYDDSANLQQIQAIAGQPNVNSAGLHAIPIGLTAANLKLDSSFVMTTRTAPGDPMVCAQVSKFDLQIGFENTTVYLAREIPRHSCGYESVLAHESRHIATDRWLLATYLPQLQALLAGELRRIGVVRASSAEVAEARLHAVMDDYMRELGASIASVREQQQKQIDSPAEYQRLTISCNGELAHLIEGDAPRL